MQSSSRSRIFNPTVACASPATDTICPRSSVKFILGGGDKARLHAEVATIVPNPAALVNDPLRGKFPKALLNTSAFAALRRDKPVKYRQWGEGLEHDAVM